jgi:hypothetical protein
MKRSIITSLFAASLAALAYGALAKDEVKAGGNYDKPGRAIDDKSVKAGGNYDKPGRAIDGGTVKAGGKTDKPGRAIDNTSHKKTKKDPQG